MKNNFVYRWKNSSNYGEGYGVLEGIMEIILVTMELCKNYGLKICP